MDPENPATEDDDPQRPEAPPSPPPVEADERFPSGPWKGFWVQRGIPGRQWMAGLELTFRDGRVEGHGADCVGTFEIYGRYDLKTGSVTLHKHYLGRHTVLYEGKNENDGLWVWGLWTIRLVDRGGFHLWPKGVEDPTQRREGAEADAPVEEERLVLVD